jgi:2-succinyl-5-enolpyruvyl-6-hydroxy-3-cyclohexene-1-carboxylate synthase
MIEVIGQAARGLVIVGQLRTAADSVAVRSLTRALGWPTFPDVVSGLRLGAREGPFVSVYDLAMLSPRFRDTCRPDVVLQIGSRLTSNRLMAHLETVRPREWILVDDHPLRCDPSHCTTLRIEADIGPFCKWLTRTAGAGKFSDWAASLMAMSKCIEASVGRTLNATSGLGELRLARLLSDNLPSDSILFVGNSLPIRDVNMVAASSGSPVRVAANRGASGIDGNVATAAGLANGSGAPVTALIGDIALLHDLNSLALLDGSPAPVTLIVINNNGGGIFHLLPIARCEPMFEPYFATPHGLRFNHAAAMFGLDYANPGSPDEFVAAYRNALASGAPSIVEIVTDREENAAVHKALQETIAASDVNS